MTVLSPRLGSLMDPYGRIQEGIGRIMEPNGSAVPQGVNAGQTSSIGALAQGGDVPQQSAQATPASADSPDMQAKIERNKSFLSSPEVQAGLLQFALNMLSPGGDFANAAGSGFEAAGRVATNRQEEELLQHKMDLQNKELSISERRLGLDERELNAKELLTTQKADALARRDRLFKMAGAQGQGLPTMGEEDLLNLAGELVATGDTDGAKVVVDMANSKRMMMSTDDIREYQFYRQQGGDLSFKQWQDDKITKGVPKPPPAPTASMDPKMIEAAIKVDDNVDKLSQSIPDYEMLLDTVRQAQTGKMVPLTLPIRQFMKEFGVTYGDDVTQVPILESLQAQQNKLALKLRSPAEGMGLPGAASDQDLIFLKQAGPGLATSPQANEAMAIIQLAKTRRQLEIEKAKSAYMWENGTLKGWQRHKDEMIANKSMFTPDEQAILDRMSNPEKPAPGQVQAAPKNSTTPQAAPDDAPDQVKNLWPDMTDAEKREYLGLPPIGQE